MKYYQKWLSDELDRRSIKNREYSMRAFAKNLKISPSLLSRIMSGTMDVSPKTAAQIVNASDMNPEVAKIFVESILDNLRDKIQLLVDTKTEGKILYSNIIKSNEILPKDPPNMSSL